MDKGRPDLVTRTPAQQEWAMRMHDLGSPLTIVLGRAQLLRRRVRRGDELVGIDADLEAIEAAVVRLTAALERLEREGRPI